MAESELPKSSAKHAEFRIAAMYDRRRTMQERLVDVLNAVGNVIHTYPISLPDSAALAGEELFKAKAIEAACFGRLVSDEHLNSLTASMHVDRSGPVEPYGDTISVMSETSSAPLQCIREYAYAIWERRGGVNGSSTGDWFEARQQLLRERSYTLWQEDGRPADRADEYWFRTQQFESC